MPIVEPEVLMDGAHTIERCEEVTAAVLHAVFNALFAQKVQLLKGMLLKPTWSSPERMHQQATVEEVATPHRAVFRRPCAAPRSPVLCSYPADTVGSPRTATKHLNAINQHAGPKPWKLSFSYGRALQDEALKAWSWKRRKPQSRPAGIY